MGGRVHEVSLQKYGKSEMIAGLVASMQKWRRPTRLRLFAEFLTMTAVVTLTSIPQPPPTVPPAPVRLASAPNGVTNTDTHRGFDSCPSYQNQPSNAVLQAWWYGSPWYDFYVYIGGSHVNCGPEITASYISQANTTGYGLLPIWGGPQAPCGNGGISGNAGTAYSQGTSEANAAVGHAFYLGFRSPNAIVYDLEYYPLNQPWCIAATNSFVNGWNQQVTALGWTSAVYSNPPNLASFFQGVNGRGITYPYAIWTADEGGTDNVWNEFGLSNASWSSDQRYSQYLNSHSETWGGQTLTIDSDCANSVMDGSGYEIFGENGGEGGNDPAEDPHCN